MKNEILLSPQFSMLTLTFQTIQSSEVRSKYRLANDYYGYQILLLNAILLQWLTFTTVEMLK